MAKRQPIAITDNPLDQTVAEPSRDHVQERSTPIKPLSSARPSDNDERAAPAPQQAPPRTVAPRGSLDASSIDPPLGPVRLGPPLQEAQTPVFARVPQSVALAFDRMTLAVRQAERESSQKALPAQELLAALIWRHGNGDDPEAVRELIELFREYRAARYAASIKRIETQPAA
ncbi:MAG: hypothetical protein ABI427_07115 [Solirubrobacteraceae bacterium]